MRRFVLGWKTLGCEQRFRAHIVNYADDLVICCSGSADLASAAMQHLMERLALTVNANKTRVCRVPDDTFDFLGYTFGRCYSTKTGKAYLGTRPSRKRIARLCRAIRDETSRRWVSTEVRDRVTRLNRMLLGWSNYFRLGPVSKAYRAIDAHTRYQLRWWLGRKHKAPGRGIARFPEEYLYQTLGLVRLGPRTRSFPWANA
jgi:hypothetical protein